MHVLSLASSWFLYLASQAAHNFLLKKKCSPVLKPHNNPDSDCQAPATDWAPASPFYGCMGVMRQYYCPHPQINCNTIPSKEKTHICWVVFWWPVWTAGEVFEWNEMRVWGINFREARLKTLPLWHASLPCLTSYTLSFVGTAKYLLLELSCSQDCHLHWKILHEIKILCSSPVKYCTLKTTFLLLFVPCSKHAPL